MKNINVRTLEEDGIDSNKVVFPETYIDGTINMRSKLLNVLNDHFDKVILKHTGVGRFPGDEVSKVQLNERIVNISYNRNKKTIFFFGAHKPSLSKITLSILEDRSDEIIDALTENL